MNAPTIEQPRTRTAAKIVISWLWSLYRYATDAEQYGTWESWSGALSQLTSRGFVRDDCDGFGRLMLDLLFFMAEFKLAELYECMLDTDQFDGAAFDHHGFAVRIDGVMYFGHCWAPKLLTLGELERGGYALPNGQRAAGVQVVQYRRIDGGASDWEGGHPA